MNTECDFFISYNKEDKQWAKWIAGILEENGYSTIIQAWDFKPGNNFILEMQNALLCCKKTLLVLSEDYLSSEYCKPEWAAIFNTDPTGVNRNLIPVRIAEVVPNGLLSAKIYIDLYGATEEIATKKLLLGVSDKENPRKKPEFPGNRQKETFPINIENNEIYCFNFDLNEDNKVEPLSVKTKNLLRKWYINGCTEAFQIAINDKRIHKIKENLSNILEKIQNEDNLTIAEEKQYNLYMHVLKKCEHETVLKVQACIFFLKDTHLHAYFSLSSYLEIYEIIQVILNFDYYNDKRKKMSDLNYTGLDFTIYPPPEECNNYFSVPIENSKLDEIFGGTTMHHIFGDAADLGSNLLRDVVVYYYFFLAEEIIAFKNLNIVDSPKMLNLFNYQIGLH